MKINMLIRSAFEKELGQIKTSVPPHNSFAVPAGGEKGGKKQEGRGFCVLSIIAISALSIFLLNTGTARSSPVIEWTTIINLLPEDFAAVFFEFIGAINSSV
ncbi:MAG: hypothetical protein LBK63_12435 [Treponema sp.]|jgi:hypothetical protein|nr:hypothetical protein [Treponema sp.]